MKLKLLAAAVAATLGSVAFQAGAANLGLDATCALNGTDQGMVATPDGNRRRCDLPADIVTTNPADPTITLPATVSGTPILWTLPSVVVVGNGNQAGRTPSTAANTQLTIAAGARIAGAIANSALVITRGARINAAGTAANPIVFSSLDNNYTGTAEWGGVILSSWDNTNECNTGGECTMEGISQGQFFYGGYVNEATTPSWDNVSSGTLRFAVIAEGGHAVNVDIDGDPDPNSNTGDEINGLTLYGVSSETSIANVHIHNNDDDGIEFFGGDVDVANLWISCAGDDSVDWDYGFHGALSNVNILQRDGADHAFELANNPNNFSATPVADANVSNVSILFTDGSPAVDTPFDLKEGSGGTFSNVVIGSAYTGACFSSGAVDAVSASDFTNFEYACNDNLSLLPPSSTAPTGFPNNTFWTAYPGTCN
ncbi:hypothetical protein JM946_18950 [Steroidobacter sp. S1-65]|uniref:Uncharacterized protein n=1 Tax=Steroidobacter gossypii TaxID=2805490 RepID=A0ABS1X0T7_9GAMM|nr:hypothetical protein [Steroidobacter gossypii]MBM0106817.1 hypothetical protein [Steroidobacter gossypii]